MNEQLFTEARIEREQVARRLQSIEQQYLHFVLKAFSQRKALAADHGARRQYERELAGYRQSYADCQSAAREMDWMIEALAARADP